MTRITYPLISILITVICLTLVYHGLRKRNYSVMDFQKLHESLKQPFPRRAAERSFGQVNKAVETIEIFMVVNTAPVFIQAVALLKSLLYYQGRVAQERSECSVKTGRFSRLEYVKKNNSDRQKHPLVLHLMADGESRQKIVNLFGDWKLRDIAFHIYPLESYWDFFTQLPVRHYAGTSALYKLAVPYFLPYSVEKVIVLDTDFLLNEDIYELWKHFYNFKATQVIGAVCEQIIGCPESCLSTNGIPAFGINAGMMLMNLTRMRQKNWWQLWTKEAEVSMKEKGFMDNADQSTINSILERKLELYHSLPCVWNVQVYKDTGADCCPVMWTDRDASEGSLIHDRTESTEQAQMASAVHYNIKMKPVRAAAYIESALESFQPDQQLSVYQLRHRFYQAFMKFRNLPADCIV